jgi:hypothetical protein
VQTSYNSRAILRLVGCLRSVRPVHPAAPNLSSTRTAKYSSLDSTIPLSLRPAPKHSQLISKAHKLASRMREIGLQPLRTASWPWRICKTFILQRRRDRRVLGELEFEGFAVQMGICRGEGVAQGRKLLKVKLLTAEVIIKALAFHQFFVCTLLNNFSFFDNQDQIGIADRAQTVSDNE